MSQMESGGEGTLGFLDQHLLQLESMENGCIYIKCTDVATSSMGKARSPNLNLSINFLSSESVLVPISDFDNGVKW